MQISFDSKDWNKKINIQGDFMFINNVLEIRIINQLNHIQKQQSILAYRLATGQRINSAADDAAGLAISEKMRAQIRGLRQAQRNAADGISLIQTAEGAMNEIHAILQRMREISVQAANGTYTDSDRRNLNEEFQQLKEAITGIATSTEFNTQSLLDGSKSHKGIRLQIGPNAGNSMEVTINDMRASGIGIENLDISTQEGAQEAIETLTKSIDYVSGERSKLGAIQNRLEHTIRHLENYEENLTAAESRIRDADMAATIMEYIKYQILSMTAQAILAQSMYLKRQQLLLLLSSIR